MTDDEIIDLYWKSHARDGSLDILAFARATAAAEREACARIVLGWRESDWPEGFDRRTAELLSEDRAAAIRARNET